MIPKVEQETMEKIPKNMLIPWTVKFGKRAARVNKWEQQWYERWGSARECSICGEGHPAMHKHMDENGKVSYKYNCPIASNNQWPPDDKDEGVVSIWNSLDASPSKIASFHGYSYEAIDEALEKWEHHGSGILMSPEECESFKDEAHLWCEVERQTWTFKRTLLKIYGLGEESEEHLGKMDEEQG
jgi:hypothetical protein